MASFVIATTPSLAGPVAAADRNATVAAAAAAGSGSNVVVTPGDVVHVEGDYLRGHGTYNARATQPGVPGSLLASVAGSVERVNKLVSVRVPRHRYVGEVGDVVVGRIVSVGQRSWRVDIGARQTAVLQLSSVTLPGGAQRRRTQEDRLAMRSFLREGDLISAEVQTLYQRDGTVALHTRSLKYGKLENGCLAVVPAGLIKRLKHHFVSLPCGVDVVLGRNGYLWVSETDPAMAAAARSRNSEAMQQSREAFAARDVTSSSRERIARVCQCVALLRSVFSRVSPASIMRLYKLGISRGLQAKSLLADEGMRVAAMET